jgi:hypothetical protein
MTSSPAGARGRVAIPRALNTSVVVWVLSMDQLTTIREN